MEDADDMSKVYKVMYLNNTTILPDHLEKIEQVLGSGVIMTNADKWQDALYAGEYSFTVTQNRTDGNGSTVTTKSGSVKDGKAHIHEGETELYYEAEESALYRYEDIYGSWTKLQNNGNGYGVNYLLLANMCGVGNIVAVTDFDQYTFEDYQNGTLTITVGIGNSIEFELTDGKVVKITYTSSNGENSNTTEAVISYTVSDITLPA